MAGVHGDTGANPAAPAASAPAASAPAAITFDSFTDEVGLIISSACVSWCQLSLKYSAK